MENEAMEYREDAPEPPCPGGGKHDWDNDTNCGSAWSRDIFRATGIETRAYGDATGYHGARICRKCGAMHHWRYFNGVGRKDAYTGPDPDLARKLR